MALPIYLAMIEPEIRTLSPLPPRIAYMACHFSPYGRGLSNRPKALPPDSLLILNDRIPIHGHDPELIGQQLKTTVAACKCSGVLLDFQRPGCEETQALAKHLADALPCPTAVSPDYADGLTCPVFLPPPPPDIPLADHLRPWQGREIWLEAAIDGLVITVTEAGSSTAPLPIGEEFDGGHRNASLHCHYRVTVREYSACFTLFRNREDTLELLEEAEALGVTAAVGLYQQLGNMETTKNRSG